jgi:hypothetical protein
MLLPTLSKTYCWALYSSLPDNPNTTIFEKKGLGLAFNTQFFLKHLQDDWENEKRHTVTTIPDKNK